MSLHDPARWIVTYDITDPRRGARVHRFMKAQGVPLQYSVFIVEASAARMHALMLELEALIAPAMDDVRAYRWTVQAESHALGKSLLPDGVLIGAEAAQPTRRVVRRAAVKSHA
jgi:CRISPR-associated protein Cas2